MEKSYEFREKMSLYELVDCCTMNARDGDIIYTTFHNDGTVLIDIRNMYLGKKGEYIIDQNGKVLRGTNPVVKSVDLDLKRFTKEYDGCSDLRMTKNGLQLTTIG